LPNIAYYLASSGLDSTEVMLNWELDYMKKHPSVVPASDFEITDAEYEDFKQRVQKSGFTYDRESGKYLEDLVKWAKFEGYYDGAKAEFDALEAKLTHNLAHELEYNKETIKQLLAADLMSVYYYNRGAVENALRHDKQWKEAVRLLNHPDEYGRILGVKE
jgi:carboxyl-terminal processing protease